jgi:tight adherence protein C
MQVELILAVFAVFATVALVAGSGLYWWLARAAPEQRRIRDLTQAPSTGVVIDERRLAEAPDPFLARLSKFVPKSPTEMSRLQKRLTRGGYPHFKAVVYYSLSEIVLPVILVGLVLMVFGFAEGWLFALFAAAVGYMAPALYVGRRTRLRQKAIQNGLPDALDLLTICVEAGSGLDQAIVKTSEELQIAHPVLADELRFVTTEMRAGKPRLEAFKNLAQRTGVDEVRTLVAMLTQTDRFGTSIGQALRTHAETSRTKRRQRAEERAAKVSVKLVFPLALCLFPALYVVCFGPVVVQIYHAFIENG